MEAIIWLIIFAVLVVIEIMTLGLTTIWFAVGALVAFLAAMFDAPVWGQIILFLIVSVAALIATRPMLIKSMSKNKVMTNVDSLIGKTAIVQQEINNLKSTGQVLMNGMEWTARSISAKEIIPEQVVVKVLAIDGVKLIVEQTPRTSGGDKQETNLK